MLRCAMNREKEQIETVRVSGKARRHRVPSGSVLSDDISEQLRRLVRALARSAAVAEHRSAEKERKDQT
jgi:hypothetical protein